MTVSRLLSEAPSTEIAGWMVVQEIEEENRIQRVEDEKKKKAETGMKVMQARLTQAGIAAAAKKRKKRGKNKAQV